MPRFVIQYHKTDRSHYDLMLERGGELVTFSIYHPLDFESRDTYPAVLKDPHPMEFLEYEGPLAKEGGSVTIWDSGTYAAGSWKKLDIRVKLHGRKIKGSFRIHCESEIGKYYLTVIRAGEAESDRPKGDSTTSKLNWRGKMFEVYEEEHLHEGKKLRWEVLRKKAAVAVVPITPDGRAVLVKQFRYPLLKYLEHNHLWKKL